MLSEHVCFLRPKVNMNNYHSCFHPKSIGLCPIQGSAAKETP